MRVGTNMMVEPALLGAWATLGYGTILRFAELHPDLVVSSPSLALGLVLRFKQSSPGIRSPRMWQLSPVATGGPQWQPGVPSANRALGTPCCDVKLLYAMPGGGGACSLLGRGAEVPSFFVEGWLVDRSVNLLSE